MGALEICTRHVPAVKVTFTAASPPHGDASPRRGKGCCCEHVSCVVKENSCGWCGVAVAQDALARRAGATQKRCGLREDSREKQRRNGRMRKYTYTYVHAECNSTCQVTAQTSRQMVVVLEYVQR